MLGQELSLPSGGTRASGPAGRGPKGLLAQLLYFPNRTLGPREPCDVPVVRSRSKAWVFRLSLQCNYYRVCWGRGGGGQIKKMEVGRKEPLREGKEFKPKAYQFHRGRNKESLKRDDVFEVEYLVSA